ncbi:hypothetical protein [Helicobacter sp.]|nr:hypothetical protein [Helicobacter sp.]
MEKFIKLPLTPPIQKHNLKKNLQYEFNGEFIGSLLQCKHHL